jgi:hypothetical protein
MVSELSGSPMSLYDFYMYLQHIEFSAENLEFYMWYAVFYPWVCAFLNSRHRFKDYEKRFLRQNTSRVGETDVSNMSSSEISDSFKDQAYGCSTKGVTVPDSGDDARSESIYPDDGM